MAAPQPILDDYSQPTLPTLPSGGGWYFNSLDYQIVTKSESWNQNQAARLNEYQAGKDLGINFVSLAVPYDNVTKYTNYVTDARSKGFKVWHRSHWNNWQGDNSAAADLSAQNYLDQTYDFIVNNPTLFQNGDMFGTCVECNNADGVNSTGPFRTAGSFSFSKYNAFLKDQVRYANAAFKSIGKTIYTWPISFSLSLMNLNGQALDSGDGGNSSGLGNADIVNYFGGILTIDHYLSNAYRFNDSTKYWDRYSSDLDKIHAAFPDCKIMIGEWGYHTTVAVSAGEKHGMFEQLVNVLKSKSYIIGVNFWVHMGSNTASIFESSAEFIQPGGSNVKNAIKRAFNIGNNTAGLRVRV